MIDRTVERFRLAQWTHDGSSFHPSGVGWEDIVFKSINIVVCVCISFEQTSRIVLIFLFGYVDTDAGNVSVQHRNVTSLLKKPLNRMKLLLVLCVSVDYRRWLSTTIGDWSARDNQEEHENIRMWIMNCFALVKKPFRNNQYKTKRKANNRKLELKRNGIRFKWKGKMIITVKESSIESWLL